MLRKGQTLLKRKNEVLVIKIVKSFKILNIVDCIKSNNKQEINPQTFFLINPQARLRKKAALLIPSFFKLNARKNKLFGSE